MINPFTEGDLFSILYSNIENIEIDSNQIILTKDGLLTFREIILKYPQNYLESLIRPYSEPNYDNKFVFEPFTFKIFNGYKGKGGVLGFEEFLKELCSSLSNSNSYQKVVYMYAAMIALREKMINNDLVEENHKFEKNHEDSAIYFEDYELWSIYPQNVRINERLESNYKDIMNNIISRICPLILD